MGRTTKFTFPVPGRKQKKFIPDSPADFSAPLTKAQKILGTPELNVDTPLPKEHSKFWENRSNSGISISISESTAAFTNETGFGRRDEREAGRGVGGRHAQWEDESAIIPRGHNVTGPRGDAAHDTITAASSVRRQRSSSTINTYYDKSKVPLSISQQTASSAMAKGLPGKASALLDMDGTYNVQPNSQKKSPLRLDLSYLIPRNMSSKHSTGPNDVPKDLVLGPDLVTRSPSFMSASPDTASPHSHQEGHRKPRKKLTLESLRRHRQDPITNMDTPKMRTASSVNELHNLYEHYEQRSFEEMAGAESAGATTGAGSPRWESSLPSASGGKEFLSPYSNSASRTNLTSRDGSKRSSQASGVETATTSLMTPSSLKSRPTDSASVSSRHTRTSKASKRTDRSMTDFDLRQNSVLSLSSDSEDEYDDCPGTSVSSVPRRQSDSQPSPASPDLNSFPRPPSPPAVDANSMDLPFRHAGASPSNSHTQFAPREGPASDQGVIQPGMAARKSPLSGPSGEVQKAGISRSSPASTAAARSATKSGGASSARRDSASQEFRQIALIPAQGSRYHRNAQPQGASKKGTRLSGASDRSRPLSPTSVDFYLQSRHNSMAFDSGSIRSGKSVGTIGSASMRSSIASTIVGEERDGRFIAVTRQEEMLLAALRQRRARMRDEIAAEFGEEQSDPTDCEDVIIQHPQSQDRYDQRTLRLRQSSSKPTMKRLSGESKRLSSRQLSRNSSFSTVRLASLPEQPYGEQQQLQPASRAPSSSTLRNSSSNASGRHSRKSEQILLYLRHPSGEMDPADIAEPSLDLDDFSDFDYLAGDIAATGTISEAGSASLSGSASAKSQTSSQPRRAGLSPAVSARNSQSTIIKGKSTTQRNPPPGSNHDQQARGAEGGRLRFLEDGFAGVRSSSSSSACRKEEVDIPRPDSPISPAVDLPTPVSELPRKKQVRLSAVGYHPMETSLWGDDG